MSALLTRRIGPFAVWLWAAAGVGGLLVLRRLRGGSSGGAATAGSSSGGSSSDLGAAAFSPQSMTDTSGGGGGAPGDPLNPDQQNPVDPGIASGGFGAATVFDPTTGATTTTPIGSNDGGTTALTEPVPFDAPGGIGNRGGIAQPSPAPASTRGQRSGKNGKGSKPAHPATKSHHAAPKPTATSGRNQGHAAPAPAVPRSGVPTKAAATQGPPPKPATSKPAPKPAPATRPAPKPAGGGGRPARAL